MADTHSSTHTHTSPRTLRYFTACFRSTSPLSLSASRSCSSSSFSFSTNTSPPSSPSPAPAAAPCMEWHVDGGARVSRSIRTGGLLDRSKCSTQPRSSQSTHLLLLLRLEALLQTALHRADLVLDGRVLALLHHHRARAPFPSSSPCTGRPSTPAVLLPVPPAVVEVLRRPHQQMSRSSSDASNKRVSFDGCDGDWIGWTGAGRQSALDL